jgi:hypothetical protein
MGSIFSYAPFVFLCIRNGVAMELYSEGFLRLGNSDAELEPVFQKSEAVRIAPVSNSLYDRRNDCYRTPCDKDDPFYNTCHQAGYGFFLMADGKRLTVYGISSPAIQWVPTERKARNAQIYLGRHSGVFTEIEDGPHDVFTASEMVLE